MFRETNGWKANEAINNFQEEDRTNGDILTKKIKKKRKSSCLRPLNKYVGLLDGVKW